MTRDERGENWLGVPLGGLSHSVVYPTRWFIPLGGLSHSVVYPTR